MDGTIEEVQETAPLIEDRSLIFLLCQLVVDVLKLNRLGVETVGDSADTIGKHSLKGNGLLGCLRYTVVSLGFLNHSFNLSLLFCVEICGNSYLSFLLFLLEKQ